MKKFISISVVMALFAAFAAPMSVHIDHRGLFIIRGVTCPGGANWPGSNLVAFGPNWQYSAQDYAANVSKKQLDGWDCDVVGTINTPGAKAKIRQEYRFNKDKSCTLKWSLAPDGRANLNMARAYLNIPLEKGVFGGGRYKTDSKGEVAFPDKEAWLPKEGKTVFISKDGKTSFEIRGVKCGGWKLVIDEKTKAPFIQMDFADPRGAALSEIQFTFVGEGDSIFAAKEPPKKEIIEPGKDWVAFPFESNVKDGTVLDFARIFENDIPAGRYGRIVAGKNGRFVYEKTGKPVRLIGANLNFDANMMDKKLCDDTARDFRKMGYNAVRYHHIDVTIQKGGWNAWSSANFDPVMLDRLDYMFYAMKREGMYSTLDLFQMRRCGKGEIEGIDHGLDWAALKSYLPYCKPAVDNWKMFARKLLDHENPYTKMKWKDDPSLVFIVPVNEDSVASVSPRNPKSQAHKYFKKAYDEWMAKGLSKLPKGAKKEALEIEFMNYSKAQFDKETIRFLKEELGCKALVTSENWWDLRSQTYLRDNYDLVDNHGYADHPQGWPRQRWNQGGMVKHNHFAYHIPIMKAPSRIMDRPMAITEWNFCAPNRYRAESGPIMGAYSAFQDWGAIYRFAWSHTVNNIKTQSPIKHFDIVNDPINQISERIAVLLFRRGDVKVAEETLCYAVNLNEATKHGCGDMWARGLFPAKFITQGFTHRIGSQFVEPGKPIRGKWTKVVSEDKLDASLLNGNVWQSAEEFPLRNNPKGDLVSDTGEIIQNSKGRFTVTTPKTEVIVAYPHGDDNGKYTAGGLIMKTVDTMTVVAASALDKKTLRDSKEILFFHLTNAYNSGMQFESKGWHEILNEGKLPYLAKTGEAEVAFKSNVKGLKLFAVRYDGTIIREVPMVYRSGHYVFRMSIDTKEEPVMTYVLRAR